jgi:hypothetical protein
VRIEGDDALIAGEQLLHERETGAAEADDAGVGADVAVETRQRHPATIFPDGGVN